MDYAIKFNSKKLVKDLKNYTKKLERVKHRLFPKIANMAMEGIEDRTHKGIDSRFKSFPPYTPKYAKFRLSRTRGLVPVLDFSGKMWSALTHTSLKDRVRLFFTGKYDLIAHGQHTGQRRKGIKNPRPFFELDNKQVTDINNFVFREISKVKL